jgi:hypothetical protein
MTANIELLVPFSVPVLGGFLAIGAIYIAYRLLKFVISIAAGTS